MKKTRAALLIALAFAVSFVVFACNNFSDFGIPENVYVKTSGAYSGALGKKCYDLSEKLGGDFMADLEKNMEGDVYKYIPDSGDETLAYILHKKVYDVPLDVSEYLDSMKLNENIGKDLSFSKEFELPSVDKVSDIPLFAGASGPFPFDFFFNLTVDETVTAATIGSGEILIKSEAEGVQGALLDIATFSLTGIVKGDGSSFGPGDFTDLGGAKIINKRLNLAGAKLVIPASQIRAVGSLAKTAGTVDAADKISYSIFIEELSSATADFSGVGGFEMNDTTDNKSQVSKEMVAYVNTINFGQNVGTYYYKSDANGARTNTKGQGKGLKFKAINSFPAGNDIDLTIVSTTFGIDSSDGSIYSNGEPATSAKISGRGTEDAFDQNFEEYGDVDVTDTSKFGTKDNPKYIMFSVKLSNAQTFTNLRMGQKYKLAVSDSEMLFDWDKATINLANVDPVQDSSDMSNFSIDSMLSELDGEISKLVANCAFKSVPVYFFVNKPTGALASEIGDVSLDGKVYFSYTDSSSAQQKDYIAGSETETVAMPVCDAIEWPAANEVCSKVFAEKGKDYSFMSDVAGTLNKRPKDLSVDYSMAVNGGALCNLYKARFDSMGENDTASIAIEMAAVLSFALDVVTETKLDIYKLADSDMDGKKDLLERDTVTDTTDYAKYVGAISFLRLNYNFVNTAIEGLAATVSVDDTHEGEANADAYSGIVREMEITGDDSSDDVIDFTNDEIKAVLTHFFKPKMTLTVPQETLVVKRSAVESDSSVGISPIVLLQLNDSTAIDIKDIIK